MVYNGSITIEENKRRYIRLLNIVTTTRKNKNCKKSKHLPVKFIQYLIFNYLDKRIKSARGSSLLSYLIRKIVRPYMDIITISHTVGIKNDF